MAQANTLYNRHEYNIHIYFQGRDNRIGKRFVIALYGDEIGSRRTNHGLTTNWSPLGRPSFRQRKSLWRSLVWRESGTWFVLPSCVIYRTSSSPTQPSPIHQQHTTKNGIWWWWILYPYPRLVCCCCFRTNWIGLWRWESIRTRHLVGCVGIERWSVWHGSVTMFYCGEIAGSYLYL